MNNLASRIGLEAEIDWPQAGLEWLEEVMLIFNA